MKESIVYYKSFYEAIKPLQDDLRHEVQDAILEYSFTNELPENMSALARAFVTLMTPQIDANARRYESAKHGGAPVGNKNASKSNSQAKSERSIGETETNRQDMADANLIKPDNEPLDRNIVNADAEKICNEEAQPEVNDENNQKQPTVDFLDSKKQPNDNVNDNENLNVNYNENININANASPTLQKGTIKASGFIAPKPLSAEDICISYSKGDKDLEEALRGFILMRKNIKMKLTPSEMHFMLSNLDRIASTNAEKVEIITKSIRNRWKDLYPPKKPETATTTEKKYTFTNMDNHEYEKEDYSGLFGGMGG